MEIRLRLIRPFTPIRFTHQYAGLTEKVILWYCSPSKGKTRRGFSIHQHYQSDMSSAELKARFLDVCELNLMINQRYERGPGLAVCDGGIAKIMDFEEASVTKNNELRISNNEYGTVTSIFIISCSMFGIRFYFFFNVQPTGRTSAVSIFWLASMMSMASRR